MAIDASSHQPVFLVADLQRVIRIRTGQQQGAT